jgi:hypothetical protein
MNETLSLSKFRQLVGLTSTKSHESALMFCCLDVTYGNKFSLFWIFIEEKFNQSEMREMLLQETFLGFTAFDYAVLNENLKNFDSFLTSFEEVLGQKESKSFIATLFNAAEFYDEIKIKSEDDSAFLEF